ncbi:MAG: hypothetical protein LBC73_09000 [Oscillospiraceae bacterium]|jgi:ABC-type glycerol-3-phosphate transport system substrate-binding protein|nr:hypothetical protein [Oscillospiraceae bacterium]
MCKRKIIISYFIILALCVNIFLLSCGNNNHSSLPEILHPNIDVNNPNDVIEHHKSDENDLSARIQLNLATLIDQTELMSAVRQFNNTSTTYFIEVINYSDFLDDSNFDWSVPLNRMIVDIITGNVADIYNVAGLPFHQFATRGLFEDLYPFIDADDELNRSDLMSNVLRAAEIDGNLYNVFPYFTISTLLGNPTVLGRDSGWDMEEFKAVLMSNPLADMPIGDRFDKESLLRFFLRYNLDEYIDWVSGTTYFDRGDFEELLSFANTFPNEFPLGYQRQEEHELISTGRQLVTETDFSNFFVLRYYRALYGGELVFKGFPAENRDGHAIDFQTSIAITSISKNKSGAWEFVRMFLTEDFQTENNLLGRFPTNKTVFNSMLTEAVMSERFEYDIGTRESPFYIMIEAITQDEVSQIMQLIDSITRTVQRNDALMNIIMETTSDFFNNKITIQDAVRIIQSRASIYVAEHSR